MNDFLAPNFEPIERRMYFCVCASCKWASDELAFNEHDAHAPDSCPECGGDDFTIESDYFEI